MPGGKVLPEILLESRQPGLPQLDPIPAIFVATGCGRIYVDRGPERDAPEKSSGRADVNFPPGEFAMTIMGYKYGVARRGNKRNCTPPAHNGREHNSFSCTSGCVGQLDVKRRANQRKGL